MINPLITLYGMCAYNFLLHIVHLLDVSIAFAEVFCIKIPCRTFRRSSEVHSTFHSLPTVGRNLRFSGR